MTFGESVKTCFNKYVTFSGRAIRSEYWWFYLFCIIISFVLGIIEGVSGINYLGTIWSLAILLPSIAAGVRRMHDGGRSGWYLLIPFYNIYLLAIPGDSGPNEYGEDPLNPGQQFDFDRPNYNA